MSVTASVLICCIVFILWFWLKPRKNAPPCYPGAWPIIGHAHQMFGNRKREYTSYLWSYLQKIFHYSLEKGGVLELWIGPHSVYASIWRSHRKLLDAAFSQKVLDTFVDEMNTQTQGLVTHLSAQVGKGPFDVRQYLINYTLKTVSRTSLGLDAKDQTMIDEAYADALEDLISVYCERAQKVWLHLSCIYDRSSLRKKQDYLLKIMNNIIDAVIMKRKSDLKNNNKDGIENIDKVKSALDQMLQLADAHHVFSDEEIREHLDTFVAAAYDTTSGTLTYVLLAIGSHPEVQEKILAEIQAVQPNKNENISKLDLQKLVYVEAVIKEALRLYSPMPGVARKIQKDVKLMMKLAVVYLVRNYHLLSDISKLESEYDIVLKAVSGHLISLSVRS
ncbi:hypothetical protein HF086_009950 [Spodoptera exigua]|uniref:Cytochrome p450 n=1 Tax=Spodoptera exigua TaxID=7107 RepID=A0A922M6N7_SPOEX|nr:hypothetical protein HF086_009950 [Spodoptera exigua]